MNLLTSFLYVFTGCAPPLYSGVYVSGHFNDLAAVAFLPPRQKERQIRRIMMQSAATFNHQVTAQQYIDLYEKMLRRPLVNRQNTGRAWLAGELAMAGGARFNSSFQTFHCSIPQQERVSLLYAGNGGVHPVNTYKPMIYSKNCSSVGGGAIHPRTGFHSHCAFNSNFGLFFS